MAVEPVPRVEVDDVGREATEQVTGASIQPLASLTGSTRSAVASGQEAVSSPSEVLPSAIEPKRPTIKPPLMLDLSAILARRAGSQPDETRQETIERYTKMLRVTDNWAATRRAMASANVDPDIVEIVCPAAEAPDLDAVAWVPNRTCAGLVYKDRSEFETGGVFELPYEQAPSTIPKSEERNIDLHFAKPSQAQAKESKATRPTRPTQQPLFQKGKLLAITVSTLVDASAAAVSSMLRLDPPSDTAKDPSKLVSLQTN